MGKLLAILVLAACFLGCDSNVGKAEKLENVVRVFMSRPHAFIFAVQNPETKIITLRGYYAFDSKDVEIIPDVLPDGKMWVELGASPHTADSEVRQYLKIHVYSEKSVEGGAWNNGKGGRGQNQVIK